MEDITNNASPEESIKVQPFLKSWSFWRPFLGIVLGGAAGVAYYFLGGWTTGTCPLTSNIYSTAITGGVFGLIITSSPCARSKC
jgi:hypothetical protein